MLWVKETNLCCSFAKLCPTHCDPVDCSMPGFPVPHQLPEFAQVHVYCTGDAIQPFHLLMPSSPAVCLLQHQDLFQWVSSPKYWSFIWQNAGVSASSSVFPTSIQGWFPLRLTGLNSLLSRVLLSQESFTTPQFKGINSLMLHFLYGQLS